ncbi:anthranilate synthase component I family protein [Nocardioides nanhaiensis]|uniref:Chorismate-utilising enzyme C-terminal domain-containing protein n=1 Tax=Nocardioides nanhaiensis TaxID=1476871 RepID=A0ABP8VQR5_9ACTN
MVADIEHTFTRVAERHARCFWLDGGGARDWSGRRSILGWLDDEDVSLTYSAARREVLRHEAGEAVVVGDDPFAVLEEELARGHAHDQWFGYLGYACRPDLPALVEEGGVPDAVWMRSPQVRFFEHPASGAGRLPRRTAAEPQAETPVPDTYAAAFARVQEHLRAGNTYEVNLTHRLGVGDDVPPHEAYLRLRSLNPAPYAGFLQHDVPGASAWLLSSSPERFATVGADRTVETKPIKGTTPRRQDPADDERERRRLATDPRFRAENLMIVDLLRNDLAMVCEPGTVEVPALMQVESYETVHQLVSTVRGRLRDEMGTVAALRALFPAGSMTGAPKRRTMEVIAEVESTARGAYAGAFGWISGDGRADLGVVIRSLTSAGDGHWQLGTGGGITVLSEVADEHAEASLKAARLLEVLGPGSAG